jgi:hypothetical protein
LLSPPHVDLKFAFKYRAKVSARKFEIQKKQILEPKLHPQVVNVQRRERGAVCVVVISLPLVYSSMISQHGGKRKNRKEKQK